MLRHSAVCVREAESGSLGPLHVLMEDGSAEIKTGSTWVPSSEEPRSPNPELKKLLLFKVYKRRWFVLLVLCLLNCSNATLWLTFAPVADQSAKFLAVALDKINWLSVVYMVVAIPLSFGTTWLLDTLGLRTALILGAWLNMFGALLRFVGASVDPAGSMGKYLIVMSGQTLGAMAQPLLIFTPTKVAAHWFPEHQRAIANMIASMSNPAGILLASILSPMIAQTPARIPELLLVYAVPACVVCFLATLGIRSSSPPTPPSASAVSSGSEPYLQGIKLLLRNRAYLVLMLCFGSGVALFTCFSTLLQQILCVQGYTNTFAGVCNALSIVFGIVGAAALGVYVDKTKKFIEATKVNMMFTALSCIAFSVVFLLKRQKAAVAAACSIFGFFGFSVFPVAMELSVECSYPVGEATSSGLLFVSGQIQSILYIVLFQALTKRLADSPLSTCGDTVLSWKVPLMVMAGLCTFFNCCFVIFFNTRYRRLEAEEQAVYGTKPGAASTGPEDPPPNSENPPPSPEDPPPSSEDPPPSPEDPPPSPKDPPPSSEDPPPSPEDPPPSSEDPPPSPEDPPPSPKETTEGIMGRIF
ncbi:solute carrier family 49 member A3 isoform X1 [Pseudoliparis swirei]|uniref:solute carrier family 49 member A3 isoform X1 n=1 Tax=Pseudoliparis swirei TaxID=2059687 RepID=UPI0024BEE49B|nr:solute carrier family 49 member A3 isoform X1 [Pseudoliparis swirei]